MKYIYVCDGRVRQKHGEESIREYLKPEDSNI
jgi:hypothetical protein